VRIISWNINGLRAILAENFTESIQFLDLDILCLQEIKVRPSQLSNLVLCNIRSGMFSVEQGEGGRRMRIISWNINGLRAIFEKNMQRFSPWNVLVLCNIRSGIRGGMFSVEQGERGGE
jgi:exonuclease III